MSQEELNKDTVKADIEEFMLALDSVNKIIQAMYKRLGEIKKDVEG